jgi:pyrroline-5-carboxylate reductase
MDKLGIIGGGAMGSALLKGVIQAGLVKAEAVFMVEPDQAKLSSLKSSFGISSVPSGAEIARECRVIILAVKPQIMAGVLNELGPALDESHLVISIAAGISLSMLESCSPKAKFIRVMPNTPARIGQGASAYCLGKNCGPSEQGIVEAIFGCVGVVMGANESQMHAITGLSGSGPAYVFHFIESLIDAGVMLGLSRDMATTMAVQTVLGSAELMKSSNEHPGKLKNEVTSPGGTTAAGLFELEQGAVSGTIMKAVRAAAERSKELASNES